MSFPMELRDAMERARLTPEQVAARMQEAGCEVTVSAINTWLSGSREPGGRKLVMLAHVLGVAADELMPVPAS